MDAPKWENISSTVFSPKGRVRKWNTSMEAGPTSDIWPEKRNKDRCILENGRERPIWKARRHTSRMTCLRLEIWTRCRESSRSTSGQMSWHHGQAGAKWRSLYTQSRLLRLPPSRLKNPGVKSPERSQAETVEGRACSLWTHIHGETLGVSREQLRGLLATLLSVSLRRQFLWFLWYKTFVNRSRSHLRWSWSFLYILWCPQSIAWLHSIDKLWTTCNIESCECTLHV